jgi:hypothetical protein
MSIFTSVKSGGDGNVELPFNPLLAGWRYIKTNCCEAHFEKDDVVIKAGERMVFEHNGQVVKVSALPKNQLQFLIKTQNNGINRNDRL